MRREDTALGVAVIAILMSAAALGVSMYPKGDALPGTNEYVCEQAGGQWTEFPNACADSCAYNRGEVDVCAQVMTAGCDCGPGMCWNGLECVDI